MRNFEIAARTLCLRVCGATPRFTAAVKIPLHLLDKVNERARAKRRMETEEQKKMRLGTKALISSELK